MIQMPRSRWSLAGAGVLALMVVASACSSSSKSSSSSAAAAATTAAPAASPSTTVANGAMFSTANVPGLGTVVVDARGWTVYMLKSGPHTNGTCDDASGCTKFWPDLPLPSGTTSATAGPGIDASKLSSMKLASGESYPTYGGWLMYEFVKDTAPGQSHGEGVSSFGGTWYAVSPSGDPVTGASSSPTTAASGTGY